MRKAEAGFIQGAQLIIERVQRWGAALTAGSAAWRNFPARLQEGKSEPPAGPEHRRAVSGEGWGAGVLFPALLGV